MAKWSYTLADFPELVRERLVHQDSDPTVPEVQIYAPCCGRKTTAESVIDVRDVPGTIVCAGGIYEPRDHDWLCDGCQFRLFADDGNDWTEASLYRARRAPAAIVNDHVVREWLETARAETFARFAESGEQFFPGEMHERLTEQVLQMHLQAALDEAEALRART